MAEAQQRNVGQKVEEVATKAPEEKSMLKTFFSRARVLGVFLVGVAIGTELSHASNIQAIYPIDKSLNPSTQYHLNKYWQHEQHIATLNSFFWFVRFCLHFVIS